MNFNFWRFATIVFVSPLVFLGSAATGYAQPQPAVMPKNYTKLFHKYCFQCHDSATQEGSVDLETIPLEISSDIQTAERWAKVLNAINSGEMPPEDSTPISDKEKFYFLKKLSKEMVLARRILSDNGGEILLRRLNRREYANTVEELLGVRPNVDALPNDRSAAGFDTEGASLFVSSDQLERYLEVAEEAIDIALAEPPSGNFKVRRTEPEKEFNPIYSEQVKTIKGWKKNTDAYFAQAEGKNAKPPSEFGFLDEYAAKKQLGGVRAWLPQLEEYFKRPESKTGVPLIISVKGDGMTRVKLHEVYGNQAGEYKIRVRAAAYKDAPERFQYLEFIGKSSRSRKRLGWRKVRGTLEKPEIIEFPITQPRGESMRYLMHQRTHQNRGDINLWETTQRKNGLGTPPGVWVDWAEIVLVKKGGDSHRKKIFFKRPKTWSEKKYARKVLDRFASRAFRGKKPVDDYLDRLMGLFSEARSRDLSFGEAIKQPLAVILSSPSFLYMAEPLSKKNSETLDDRELAVRLSYLLWSSPPDEQLLKLASRGRLSSPSMLRTQTERLLKNPRSDRFIRSFTEQWLDLDRIDMFQFNGVTFPNFDNAVRQNAREELIQMVKLLVADDLPLSELLSPDFLVVNDLMADFYGLPPVKGHEFVRVQPPADSVRGGLLGTAAIHCMGSDGVRTSPVERGAWVLRHLMNDPPPPAPPNVPQLSRIEGEVLTGRALQKAHQEQPQCAQCHQKIDPIGFALENFDPSGLWREAETVVVPRKPGKHNKWLKKQYKDVKIDTRGELSTGEKFDGFYELRDAIGKRKDDFARGFTESLIGYGLGRPFAFTDEELANTIVSEARAKDYRITEFIHALIQSDTFKSR